jgi:mono/diheme cytochrome c family protein
MMGAMALFAVIAVAHLANGQGTPVVARSEPQLLPAELLAGAVHGDEQVRRGQYLVAVGDCISCHLRPGGEALAGGLGLKTPFGVIYSSNITPDRETGIGNWNSDQFYHAMHDGKDEDGNNLYPAFPYPWFHRVSREDDDAILTFLKTVPAVKYTPPENSLHFPMSIRSSVKGWNFLYLDSKPFKPDARQSDEWNRGAYLVTGLGHCGGCHTPKNAFGADKNDEQLAGGTLDNWVAPDLTNNERTGVGRWSVEDIAEYLKSGRNALAAAGGAMADVIRYSTAYLTDADRHAIAVYLKSQPASATLKVQAADPVVMQQGAAIYSDACASCHLEKGVGQPRYFPPLGHNAVVQQHDPTGLAHLILGGTHIGAGRQLPTAFAMPSFAWKLSDAEIAAVTTYIRSSWGNEAPPVSAAAIADARRRLGLEQLRLTVNSGDRQ